MSSAATGCQAPPPVVRLLIWIMPWWTRIHLRAYRAVRGRFLNRTTAGGSALLSPTTGRRSARSRTVALGYLDDGEDLDIAASNGGQAQEPGWIFNLYADSTVEVDIGRDRFTTRAQILEGIEREQQWQGFTAASLDHGDGERWAGRTIPLVRLPRPAREAGHD